MPKKSTISRMLHFLSSTTFEIQWLSKQSTTASGNLIEQNNHLNLCTVFEAIDTCPQCGYCPLGSHSTTDLPTLMNPAERTETADTTHHAAVPVYKPVTHPQTFQYNPTAKGALIIHKQWGQGLQAVSSSLDLTFLTPHTESEQRERKRGNCVMRILRFN